MGKLSVIFERRPLPGLDLPIVALAYDAHFGPQHCAVVHYTRLGACLSCGVELPEAFLLRPVDSSIERICHVVWRHGHLVGVEYVNLRTFRRERAGEVRPA
jgi:hypothetical protein